MRISHVLPGLHTACRHAKLAPPHSIDLCRQTADACTPTGPDRPSDTARAAHVGRQKLSRASCAGELLDGCHQLIGSLQAANRSGEASHVWTQGGRRQPDALCTAHCLILPPTSLIKSLLALQSMRAKSHSNPNFIYAFSASRIRSEVPFAFLACPRKRSRQTGQAIRG